MDIIEKKIGTKTVRLVSDDITARDVVAIVNAANSHLQHGGGVAGIIVRKGGQVLCLWAARQLRPPGSSKQNR